MKGYSIFILDHRTYCINSLGDSLAQLGHKVAYQSSWEPKEVEAGIAYFKPDILITVGYNGPLFSRFKEIIPQLCDKYRLFHLYWATEDLINHSSWSLPYVEGTKPDLVWTIHPECIEKYERLGIPSSYLNFGFNPRIFPKKKKGEIEKYDISLIGATHFFKRTYRFDSLQHLLFPLVKSNQRVNIWGYGWRKNKGFVVEEFGHSIPRGWLQGHLLYGNTGEVYRKSKIILGVQNAMDQVSQRTFEILGTGAFMIGSRTPAIIEMFEDKRDLVLTSSPEETIELVKYYIDKPSLRYKIGVRARQKVLENYTYHQLIEKIWPKAELLVKEKLGGYKRRR